MTPDHAEVFISSLPILSTLSLRSRASETKLVAWLRAWLRAPERVVALRGRGHCAGSHGNLRRDQK